MKRLRFALILGLALLLAACATPTPGAGATVVSNESATPWGEPEGFLPQPEAVARAITYCDQGHLAAQGKARVVGAVLALPGSAQIAEWLGTSAHAPDLALWRIELAGRWTIQGPPSEEGVTPAPLPQPTRCTVLLDARSGDLLSLEAE